MLSLDAVQRALVGVHQPFPPAAGPRSRAGVAIVLAGPADSPSICFMQRVQRRGDRWSGDIALPGGWARADESRWHHTAMRETHEEVGIELRDTQHLGDLPPLGISRHVDDGGLLGASAFYVGAALPGFRLDEGEAADAFWLRCEDLYDPRNRSTLRWSRSGPATPRPALLVEKRLIWGLTYRVLERFSARVLGARSPLAPDVDRAAPAAQARRPGNEGPPP